MRPHRARSAHMRCSGAATTPSESGSGSSTTSGTSPSTSPSSRSRSRRSCSGHWCGPGEQDHGRRPRSWRCSPPRTSPGFSSSQRSRAARGASTGSTTATGSTSSRCGSSGSSSGSTSDSRDHSSRPRSGSSAALALPLILPFGQLANEAGIDTVPGALWLRIEAELAGPGPASGQLALAIFVVGLIAATFLLPRRIARIALPLAVAATFAAMSYFAWERMVGAPEDQVFAGGFQRAWIDERLSANASVTEALRGHAVRVRPRATRPLPDRVLQLDGRPRRIRHRLDPGRPSDRARRRRTVGHARALGDNRWSPTTCSRSPASSSPVDASRRGRLPVSCSGTSAVRCRSSARHPTSSCGRRPAPNARGEVAARVEA